MSLHWHTRREVDIKTPHPYAGAPTMRVEVRPNDYVKVLYAGSRLASLPAELHLLLWHFLGTYNYEQRHVKLKGRSCHVFVKVTSHHLREELVYDMAQMASPRYLNNLGSFVHDVLRHITAMLTTPDRVIVYVKQTNPLLLSAQGVLGSCYFLDAEALKLLAVLQYLVILCRAHAHFGCPEEKSNCLVM